MALRALSLSVLLLSATAAIADEPRYIPIADTERALPFSDAVIADDIVFLSGKLGIDPATGKLVEGGIAAETRQIMESIKASLERVGTSMDRVVKCTVFLADMGEWAAMNEVYRTYFKNPPARSAVGVSGIALDARLEIECIAAMPD